MTSNFDRFTEAVRNLAANSPRQGATAPSAEQVALAAGILRLARDAEDAAGKITTCQMTQRMWNSMADAYKAVGDMAAIQGLEAPVVDAPDTVEIEGGANAGS